MSPSPFSKPKVAEDGEFQFKVPDKLSTGGRGRIPKGKYVGRCVDIEFGYSEKSNNPMWTLTFVITIGEHAGRDFKLYTVLTDNAAWKVVETLNALGAEIQPGDEVRISKSDILGIGCTMHIKDDAGRDGDGEFSKLDKISAHPKGAGYRPGKLEDQRGYSPVMDGEGAEVQEEAGVSAPPPARRTSTPAKPAAKGGKAPATLGKRR